MTKDIMIDWQTIAVGMTVLAAVVWLVWSFVPRRNAPASGCGAGCSSCPAATDVKGQAPGGFVGLDVLQASIPADAKPHGPVPTARS